MAHLIYAANMSLDGYIEDTNGRFDWTEPDEQMFRFITNLIRPAGTYLYGRRLYETMMVWESDPSLSAGSPFEYDFGEMWQAADKIVYSTTLEAASTRRTRIERASDPEAVRHLKETAKEDMLIGGANLAAHAFRAGLIDECHLFLVPIVVGGGKRALPDNTRLEIELLEERRFGNGTVFLRYRVRQARDTRQRVHPTGGKSITVCESCPCAWECRSEPAARRLPDRPHSRESCMESLALAAGRGGPSDFSEKKRGQAARAWPSKIVTGRPRIRPGAGVSVSVSYPPTGRERCLCSGR